MGSPNRRLRNTAALNRWVRASTIQTKSTSRGQSGKPTKGLNYHDCSPKARPPSFVIFCSRADAVPDSYKRYLVNSLRDEFDLPGVPVRITLREKSNPFALQAKKYPQ